MSDTTVIPSPVPASSLVSPEQWQASQKTPTPADLAEKYGNTVAGPVAHAPPTDPATGLPILTGGNNRDRLGADQAAEGAQLVIDARSARMRAALPPNASEAQRQAVEQEIVAMADQIEADAAKEYGVTFHQAVPDPRGEDERRFDEAFAPPADYQGYELMLPPDRVAGADITELRATIDAFGEVFHSMSLPGSIANSLMGDMLDGMDRVESQARAGIDPKQAWLPDHAFIERNLEPGHSWDDCAKYVRAAWYKIPASPFKKSLMDGGALESPKVVLALYRQGQRLEQKAALVAARRPKK